MKKFCNIYFCFSVISENIVSDYLHSVLAMGKTISKYHCTKMCATTSFFLSPFHTQRLTLIDKSLNQIIVNDNLLIANLT